MHLITYFNISHMKLTSYSLFKMFMSYGQFNFELFFSIDIYALTGKLYYFPNINSMILAGRQVTK